MSFVALNYKTPQADPILPPNAEFLNGLQTENVVGPSKLADEDKEMLLAASRFYFGSVQWWNAVGKDRGMRPRRFYLRSDLLPGRFSQASPTAPDQANLHAIRLPNEGQRSYFLYEVRSNLTFYVGPDFRHHR